MTDLLRRWFPRVAAMIDARGLRGRLGERAVAEARRHIAAGTADVSLSDLRHWTSVWNELMRIPGGSHLAR
ncbi:hypothetical protein [Sphingomonas nostoxanthinifaciens]|uniref:hypothetical protein n=1 Tax=Sphingomonas nostoxanthinifaciens TaxID=2872652 RepID=UPI001CC1D9DD|nr:hypothetical protein [Sphingomonas nostoxanthinifaciens]UAK24091.1 hypothetical protein K8P63_17395 [Sphingomonas nostoxanthinifaciens]